MAKQVINIGISPNDKSGDPIRSAFNKVNQNFTELYASIEAGGGGGANVTEGVTPPSVPVSGDLWYDTASGRLYIYFDASWVDSSPVPTGGTVSYSPTTASDWSGTAPTTIQEAIDRLATAVKALGGGTGA
jgi:hypothetical protein